MLQKEIHLIHMLSPGAPCVKFLIAGANSFHSQSLVYSLEVLIPKIHQQSKSHQNFLLAANFRISRNSSVFWHRTTLPPNPQFNRIHFEATGATRRKWRKAGTSPSLAARWMAKAEPRWALGIGMWRRCIRLGKEVRGTLKRKTDPNQGIQRSEISAIFLLNFCCSSLICLVQKTSDVTHTTTHKTL